jgi:hypothetical protein
MICLKLQAPEWRHKYTGRTGDAGHVLSMSTPIKCRPAGAFGLGLAASTRLMPWAIICRPYGACEVGVAHPHGSRRGLLMCRPYGAGQPHRGAPTSWCARHGGHAELPLHHAHPYSEHLPHVPSLTLCAYVPYNLCVFWPVLALAKGVNWCD